MPSDGQRKIRKKALILKQVNAFKFLLLLGDKLLLEFFADFHDIFDEIGSTVCVVLIFYGRFYF